MHTVSEVSKRTSFDIRTIEVAVAVAGTVFEKKRATPGFPVNISRG